MRHTSCQNTNQTGHMILKAHAFPQRWLLSPDLSFLFFLSVILDISNRGSSVFAFFMQSRTPRAPPYQGGEELGRPPDKGD